MLQSLKNSSDRTTDTAVTFVEMGGGVYTGPLVNGVQNGWVSSIPELPRAHKGVSTCRLTGGLEMNVSAPSLSATHSLRTVFQTVLRLTLSVHEPLG